MKKRDIVRWKNICQRIAGGAEVDIRRSWPTKRYES